MFIFGRSKTPAERLKEYKRTINGSIRDLDRERVGLERQEKQLISDIKKHAEAGQMDVAQIMAKDLVRTRRHIQKFHKLKGHLQAVSLRLQTLQSNAAMAQAMRGVTKAMGQMNRAMNIPQMQKIMMEFERQTDQMEMKEELMGDTIDETFDEEGDDEEEGQQLVMQVLDEIGVQVGDKFAAVPSAQSAAQGAAQAPGLAMAEGSAGTGPAPPAVPSGGVGGGEAASDIDRQLQERMDRLRKS